jgi:nanoRNase/pAp phosphatase (c-di-AMP/oligoRNAs hydrolase)
MNENRVQVIERLKQANNILVTVNNNPTIDQLSACLGITLLLNKIGKHASAVYSGKTPSTIEFLKPETTFQKNTDSLRDFIIALDKSKADKLRYKVEDTMVKIFITPYRTSISDKDLEFSQGDFNVDVVLALGIHDRSQVDQAIMAHGRILHDAIVMCIDNTTGDSLGTINWVEERASSLSEMVTSIAEEIQAKVLDEQISTALLTGIVSETERFRNDKTTSITMSMSSKLMASGANQQLVATELEPEPLPEPEITEENLAINEENTTDSENVTNNGTEQQEQQNNVSNIEVDETSDSSSNTVADGEIKISHLDGLQVKEEEPELPELDPNEIHINEEGELKRLTEIEEEKARLEKEVKEKAAKEEAEAQNATKKDSRLVIQPPTLGGTLTANSRPEDLEPTTDPLSKVDEDQQPILERKSFIDDQTIDKIEEAVHQDQNNIPSQENKTEEVQQPYPSSYFDNQPVVSEQQNTANPDAENARNAINDAINQADAAGTSQPEPQISVGSTPVDLNLGNDQNMTSNQPIQQDLSTQPSNFPPNLVPPNDPLPSENTSTDLASPQSPPPVPPPMMPPTGPFNS